MQIEFIRNATLILHFDGKAVLVDPMLAKKGAIPCFSFFRHQPRRNPTVALPSNAHDSLSKVTHALITHCKRGHADHLDRAGAGFLRSNSIPTYCRVEDAAYLRNKGIDAIPLDTRIKQSFLGGYITPIPAKHGHGWISSVMGRGVGYMIEPTGNPSVYIAGDTVLTHDVRNALTGLAPDIAIVAAGNASVDLGKPILMSLEEVLEFTALAPGIVVANHLEALNHCPLSRSQLKSTAKLAGLDHKMRIPQDGETIDFSTPLN